MVGVERRRGHPHTPESKAAIGRANQGHFVSEAQRRESSEKREHVWLMAYSLYKREPFLPVVEAMPMTGCTHHQLERFLSTQRTAVNDPLLTPTPEQTSKTKSRSQTIKWRGFTQDELSDFAFVKQALTSGVITEDTKNWYLLQRVYRKHRRDLDFSFAEKLRLETFLKAVSSAVQGDLTMLETYRSIAKNINSLPEHTARLAIEEEFIAAKIGPDFW